MGLEGQLVGTTYWDYVCCMDFVLEVYTEGSESREEEALSPRGCHDILPAYTDAHLYCTFHSISYGLCLTEEPHE